MVTLFPRAEVQREELPDDPELARMTFLARHLEDLQTIRFAGIGVALTELPLLERLGHRSQLTVIAVTVALAVGWYFLSRFVLERRYGRSWNGDSWDGGGSWTAGAILFFAVAGLGFVWLDQLTTPGEKSHSVNLTPFLLGLSAWAGKVIRDHTNVLERRHVYRAAVALLVACMLPTVLTGLNVHARALQLDAWAVYGLVMLSVMLFDLWLLRRSFAPAREGRAA